MSIILASGSARRRELLDQIGAKYVVMKSPADETAVSGLPPLELVAAKARLKAEAVFAEHPSAVVIGCDTIVVQGETVFEKPRSREQELEFLRAFSGKTHEVFSAVSIFFPPE